MKEDPKRIAEDHWEWAEGLLNSMPELKIDIEALEYVYTTAFIHGYKHGKQGGEK